MKRRAEVSLLAVSLALVAAFVQAQDAKDSSAYPLKGFRMEFLRGYDDLEKKFISLAEAFPQEKYAWRPGEGVRSVGEVFGHVAGGNYGYGTWLGVQPPQDIDRPGLEKESDKSKLIGALKKSFSHYREAVLKVSDGDLEKGVKMLNRQGTIREALLFVAAHQPEHLGQLIAYARMNGVVPPWTAERQQQQMKK